jgi:hypothetical protein
MTLLTLSKSSASGVKTKTDLQPRHRKVSGSASLNRSLSVICDEKVNSSFSWNEVPLLFWKRVGSRPVMCDARS